MQANLHVARFLCLMQASLHEMGCEFVLHFLPQMLTSLHEMGDGSVLHLLSQMQAELFLLRHEIVPSPLSLPTLY